MKKKLHIIITVDTEDSQRPQVVFNKKVRELKSMIYGKVEGQYFGFPKILEICDSYHIKITFFLSVFDCGKYGKKALETICRIIKEKGYDIQLHTHPRRSYDKDRREMYLYSLDEQIKIVKEGKELIKEWTGEYPIAHRAGAYGINEDTLRALQVNNIPIDSSMFFSCPNCKVTWTRNKVVEKDSLIEIPVTVFSRKCYVNLGHIKIPFCNNYYVKTDIDWATLDELKFFVQEAKNHDIRVMNLFMHSYSLVKFDKNFSHLEPDYDDIEKLQSFLDYASNDEDIELITIKEFYNRYQGNSDEFEGSDYVPCIESRRFWNQIPKKVFKRIFK